MQVILDHILSLFGHQTSALKSCDLESRGYELLNSTLEIYVDKNAYFRITTIGGIKV